MNQCCLIAKPKRPHEYLIAHFIQAIRFELAKCLWLTTIIAKIVVTKPTLKYFQPLGSHSPPPPPPTSPLNNVVSLQNISDLFSIASHNISIQWALEAIHQGSLTLILTNSNANPNLTLIHPWWIASSIHLFVHGKATLNRGREGGDVKNCEMSYFHGHVSTHFVNYRR